MLFPGELVIDNFAGGGGASTGIEAAIGRPVDIAINHDPEAIAMHAANHPETRHLCENVWKVDIGKVVDGRPVGLCWFSPDCKHFSKAKGGKPVEKKIRGLAWVALKWAGVAKPRIIVLENVEEFQEWGPLVDGRPCPRRKGMTFRRWVTQLRNLGYVVEWRELRACDYGAPTIRKRLFIIARRDGHPICWPERTHGKGLAPYRTAAECIDWNLACPSIFLTRKQARAVGVIRPLADATMRRIAKGVERYVIGAAKPFIVNITHTGEGRVESVEEPLRTITGAHRGEKALVFPFLGTYYGAKHPGGDRTAAVEEPLRTQPTENRHALVAAFLAQHNGGAIGHTAERPLSTITLRGTQQAVVTSHLLKLRGTCRDGQSVDVPAPTVTSGGNHIAEVRAFLLKYYGTPQDPRLEEPLHSVTTKHRFGLVTVHGEDYQIVDIGMRMLTPRELFRAQGFPEGYIINGGRDVCNAQGSLLDGEWMDLTKTVQVRMCGNSVAPPVAEAIIRAQAGMPAGAVAA